MGLKFFFLCIVIESDLVKHEDSWFKAFSFLTKTLVSLIELIDFFLQKLDRILVSLVEVFSRIDQSIDQILVNGKCGIDIFKI